MKFIILFLSVGICSSMKRKPKSLSIMEPKVQEEFLQRVANFSRVSALVANADIINALRDVNQSLYTLILSSHSSQSPTYNVTGNCSHTPTIDKFQILGDVRFYSFYVNIFAIIVQLVMAGGIFTLLKRRRTIPIKANHQKTFKFRTRSSALSEVEDQNNEQPSLPMWDTIAYRAGPEAINTFSSTRRMSTIRNTPPPMAVTVTN